MQLTENQLRSTIRSILTELMTSTKGKKSWFQHAAESVPGGRGDAYGEYTDFYGNIDADAYGDGGFDYYSDSPEDYSGSVDESDEAEADED